MERHGWPPNALDLIRSVLQRWWVLSPLCLVFITLADAATKASQIGMTEDSALFYYSGRQWATAGRVPYKHLWDIKPPLTHISTALFSIVAAGSPKTIHLLGVSANLLSLIFAISLTAFTVKRFTGSDIAAATTGLSYLAFPFLFRWTLTGFRPKYPFLLCLAFAIFAASKDQWVSATLGATLSAGFWQPGILAVLVTFATVGWLDHQDQISSVVVNRAAATFVAVTLASTVPIILSGGLEEMLVQVVVAPVVTGDGGVELSNLLKKTHPTLAVLSIIGAATLPFQTDHKSRWWPSTLLILFFLVALAGDLDGSPDLMPLGMLISVGVGIAVGVSKPGERSDGILHNPQLWILAVVLTAVWIEPTLRFPSRPTGEVTQLFLSGEIRRACHVRLSGPEKTMMELSRQADNAVRCWQPEWPSI